MNDDTQTGEPLPDLQPRAVVAGRLAASSGCAVNDTAFGGGRPPQRHDFHPVCIWSCGHGSTFNPRWRPVWLQRGKVVYGRRRRAA